MALVPPPTRLLPDLHASIATALKALPPGAAGAFLTVVTDTGANVVIVAKAATGWEIQGWIGKQWGEAVTGGAAVVKTW